MSKGKLLALCIVWLVVVGVVAATLILTVLVSAAGLLGAFVFGRLFGLVGPSLGFPALLAALSSTTLFYALLKGALFGLTIALCNCRAGLAVRGGYTSIPKANVNGVVNSLMLCFLINAGISVWALLT